VPLVAKTSDKVRRENKYEQFQKVSIGSGIGGNIAGSRKDVCHGTYGSGTECVMAHFGERGDYYKIIEDLQITSTKLQIRLKANCLGF